MFGLAFLGGLDVLDVKWLAEELSGLRISSSRVEFCLMGKGLSR